MESSRMLSDAHTHLGTEEELRERVERRIISLVCGSTPEEAQNITQRTQQKGTCLVPTCGVHPWYAGRYEIRDLIRWMEQCPVIGEIGMDSVWCQVPLSVQEQVFRQQLKLAAEWGKPVILHTKGQEANIARIIREYPNRYLVHWYSCESYLEEFLEQDCYVSVGPDVWWNPAVQQVAAKVPKERLLMETDGLSSAVWAWEEGRKADKSDGNSRSGGNSRKNGNGGSDRNDSNSSNSNNSSSNTYCYDNPPVEVTAALTCIRDTIGEIRHCAPEEIEQQCRDNLISGFLGNCLIV